MTNAIEFPAKFSTGDKVRTSYVRGVVKKVLKGSILVEVSEADHFQIKAGDKALFAWRKRANRWVLKGTMGDRDYSLRMDDGEGFARLELA